jgi:hypothetical protein
VLEIELEKARVCWSRYVKTKRKSLEPHLAPMAAALGFLEFDWQILSEPENPGLFRLAKL